MCWVLAESMYFYEIFIIYLDIFMPLYQEAASVSLVEDIITLL